MARFSAFLGRNVEVQYRAGDIHLSASGILVADSGRSIFLEQSCGVGSQQTHFRWEIPYQFLVRIEQGPGDSSSEPPVTKEAGPMAHLESQPMSTTHVPRSSDGDNPALLPLPGRPKTA